MQTPNKDDTDFDVSFMNPANNQALQIISDPDAQPESGFGSKLFPMGDLNADGFLDFAVASVRWDGGTPSILDAGRLYVFRSDANAVVPPPPPLPVGPPGPAGTPGSPGSPGAPGTAGAPGAAAPAAGGTAAATLAGRTVELERRARRCGATRACASAASSSRSPTTRRVSPGSPSKSSAAR